MSEIVDHGLEIGKEYFGTDAHKRTVQAVEYHYGNIQVKVYDSFYSKVKWVSLPEWSQLNPEYKMRSPEWLK